MPRRDIAWEGARSNMVIRRVGGAVAAEKKDYFSHHIRRNLPTACMRQKRR